MANKTAEELVLEIKGLENKIAPVRDRIEFLKEELRAKVQPGDVVEAGDYRLEVGETLRFDPERAKALLSEEEFNLISERVAVGAKAKAMFSEEDYREMQTVGKHRLSIKPKEDEG